MASGSQASAGLQSGASASGSNYNGQGYNMSEGLAMLGVLGSAIGEAMSGLGAFLMDETATRRTINTVTEVANDLLNTQNNVFNNIMDIATAGNWNNYQNINSKYRVPESRIERRNGGYRN